MTDKKDINFLAGKMRSYLSTELYGNKYAERCKHKPLNYEEQQIIKLFIRHYRSTDEYKNLLTRVDKLKEALGNIIDNTEHNPDLPDDKCPICIADKALSETKEG